MMITIDSLINREGTVTMKVKVRLTANDWQLYTASMNCNTAAAALNLAASKALSQDDPRAARGIFMEAAEAYYKFGATDTEPRSVFAELYTQRFGEDAYQDHYFA